MVRSRSFENSAPHSEWQDALDEEGIDVLLVERAADMDALDASELPHIALLDLSTLPNTAFKPFIERCDSLKLPVIALVSPDMLLDFDLRLGVSDFVVSPPDTDEMVTRVKLTLHRNRHEDGDEVIRAGSLVINPSTYEVSLRGKRVNLRFKEYELLRLLATNPGRVYSREALLSSIWGYDYFGGTRTVDVHIRRLRSKIEDAEHPYIETIWNVGYRFRDFSQQG
jgi:DNA-binding response OmpR family regulator